jgi:hypothetical protein
MASSVVYSSDRLRELMTNTDQLFDEEPVSSSN